MSAFQKQIGEQQETASHLVAVLQALSLLEIELGDGGNKQAASALVGLGATALALADGIYSTLDSARLPKD